MSKIARESAVKNTLLLTALLSTSNTVIPKRHQQIMSTLFASLHAVALFSVESFNRSQSYFSCEGRRGNVFRHFHNLIL